jgi:hypothetical protein
MPFKLDTMSKIKLGPFHRQSFFFFLFFNPSLLSSVTKPVSNRSLLLDCSFSSSSSALFVASVLLGGVDFESIYLCGCWVVVVSPSTIFGCLHHAGKVDGVFKQCCGFGWCCLVASGISP